MGLINCPECGKKISDKASSCPHCGNPIENDSSKRAKKTKKEYLWLFIIIVLFIFVGWLYNDYKENQMTPEKARKLSEESEQIYKEQLENENFKAREYIRIIQSDNSTLREKREAYNELIKIKGIYSDYSIDEIEKMK